MNLRPENTPPQKTNVLGIGVSRTNYRECTDYILYSAKLSQGCTVAASNVHSITSAYLDPEGYGYQLNQFSIVTPDGQPIRWALNLLKKSHEEFLCDRVRGPELMLQVCEAAAQEGVSIFLYGSTEKVLKTLQSKLLKDYPNLKIVGAISPPFRSLTEEEDRKYIQKIRNSGAGILFVSLGCPRQEKWAFKHSPALDCPILCVGAAFDFHSGNIPEAPNWMQALGLEWLFRLWQEPRRLWRRYLLLNPLYILLLSLQFLRLLPLKKRFKSSHYPHK